MIPITWSAVWLGIIIIAVIVEIITVGLWAVWFACGAACAFLALHFGATVNMQIAVFLIVSFGLEYLLRPNYVKFVCRRKSSRHAGELIGQKVRVIAPIDNANGEGRVVVGNMEWRAPGRYCCNRPRRGYCVDRRAGRAGRQRDGTGVNSFF